VIFIKTTTRPAAGRAARINHSITSVVGNVAHEPLGSAQLLCSGAFMKEKDMTKNNEKFSNNSPNAQQDSEPATICMTYYDLKRNWHRVKPHLEDKELNDILVRDFNKFTFGRWGQMFTRGDLPCEFESCDWAWEHRGRRLGFWQYVNHGACHWLVNFNLRLATLVQPKKSWRIITSEDHSTVWDGDDTLFEFNLLAFRIDPNECFELAHDDELRPGKYLPVYFAEHHSVRRAA
jgi:hypothetical protein